MLTEQTKSIDLEISYVKMFKTFQITLSLDNPKIKDSYKIKALNFVREINKVIIFKHLLWSIISLVLFFISTGFFIYYVFDRSLIELILAGIFFLVFCLTFVRTVLKIRSQSCKISNAIRNFNDEINQFEIQSKIRGFKFFIIWFSCFSRWQFFVKIYALEDPVLVVPAPVICQVPTKETIEDKRIKTTRRGLTIDDIAEILHGEFDENEIVETSIFRKKMKKQNEIKPRFLSKSELSYINMNQHEDDEEEENPNRFRSE